MIDFTNRKYKIGGSEISIVMGLNRWKTPLRLWAEKMGEIVTEDISDREYIQLGNELEEFVARRFAKLSGKKVRHDRRTFTYDKYPYMIGHIDRRVEGVNELLECKTTNAWKAAEWEGEEIPQEYILQVMWYLGITGMAKGYIAVLIGGNKFMWKPIIFDQDLFDKMVAAAKNFIENHIEKNVAPFAVSGDSNTMNRLFPEQAEAIMQTDDKEIIDTINDIQAFKRIIKNADTEKERMEAVLKQKIGLAEGVETDEYKASWKSQVTKRVDTNKIKADGLYDKYSVEKAIRVLRINKKKGKK